MRQGLQLVLAAMVLLVLGYGGYRLLFAEEGGARLQVLEASGQVSRSSATGQSPLAQGDTLQVDDAVVVGERSRALLGVGEGTRLELESSSTVRVLEVDTTGVRVELERGRVKARVRAGSTPLGLSNRGRAIYADDADFTAAVDGEGALAVDAERGSLRVDGVGEAEAQLAAGDRLRTMPGREPAIGAIPEELLLQVGWPELSTTRRSELSVSGQTEAYAEIQVGREGSWSRVRAEADGSFRATVPLDEGENKVTVRASDALGNTREEEGRVIRDSTAPDIAGSEVQWGP